MCTIYNTQFDSKSVLKELIFFIELGQPQMIKLVQSSGKAISGIMTSAMTGQPVKIFKSPPANAESSQVRHLII